MCQNVAAGRDQRRVGLREEELLRRFVACREAGNVADATRWWDELAAAGFERVRVMVDRRAGRYGFSYDEREEAVSLALRKLWERMGTTFVGTTMGEYVNAMKQLVEYACQQVQRAAAQRRERETTFDPWAPDDEAGNPDWKGNRSAQERWRRDAEKGEAAEFIAWAVPQLEERRRRVMERSLDGVKAPEIAGELGVSMANLYQLRSRALKDLAKLRGDWES
jgi:DNA-directed RNA polymerase specialized sigma24 family protein